MGLGLWILVALVALNGLVVVCGWRAAKHGRTYSPPPGSPRARHLERRADAAAVRAEWDETA